MDQWIKYRTELMTHPKFLGLLEALVYDKELNFGFLCYVCGRDALEIGVFPPSDESVTTRALRYVTKEALRDVTLALLLRVWSAVNTHCKVEGEDAILTPASLSNIDEMIGFNGFAEALEEVEWVEEFHDDHGRICLRFKNFLEHNEPACLRRKPLSNAERQKRHRETKKSKRIRVTRSNESNDREEKRRIEEKIRLPSEDVCAETVADDPSATPTPAPPEPATKSVRSKPDPGPTSGIVFPCDGSPESFDVPLSLLARYRETYPALDVEAEVRAALLWVESNPSRRKTARGMAAFLTNWLARSQNNPRLRSGGASSPAAGCRSRMDDLFESAKRKLSEGKDDA